MASSSARSLKKSSVKEGVLSREFYARDTLTVARELLGKVVTVGGVSGRIVETEAYHGEDPASHSARGETPRSKIMFGPAGVAYVYFIYGMYEMLNFVTEREGYPGAVLIRALEPLEGDERIMNGPGKLCRALGVKLSHNGQPLDGPEIRVSDDGLRAGVVLESPRVGITKATDRYWRFSLADNPHVSRAPQNALARKLSRVAR